MEKLIINPLSYYDNEGDQESIFYAWERGESRGDSVTPATFDVPYQKYMIDLITRMLPKEGRIFSIGCGNANIEHQLQMRKYDVTAIDPHPVAVKIAADKGLKVSRRSFYEVDSHEFDEIDLIFADGVLGHLYEEDRNLIRFVRVLQGHRGKILVCSNDAPRNGSDCCPHPRVEGFWHLSIPFLARHFDAAGFQVLYTNYFEYSRPISGPCLRSVIHCKI